SADPRCELPVPAPWLDPDEGKEDREEGIQHYHQEDSLNHGTCRLGAHGFRIPAGAQTFEASDQSNDERKDWCLDHADKEAVQPYRSLQLSQKGIRWDVEQGPDHD